MKLLILSLCIPTYNRASLLEQALEGIVDQVLDGLEHRIEIVISNNASTDSTKDMVEAFQRKYPQISWNLIHQSFSVGADNVQLVSTYARGDYIWLLSDDDIILPGTLEHLFRLIDRGHDCIITNHTSFTDDLKNQTEPYFPVEEYEKIYETGEAVLEYIYTYITFISILCFKKDLVNTEDYLMFYGTSMPQSYMFLDAILRAENRVLLSRPALSMRLDNTGGYQVFQVFIRNFLDLIQWAVSLGVSSTVALKIKRLHLRRHLLHLIIVLKTSKIGTLQPNWPQARNMLKPLRYVDPLYYGIIFLVLRLPPRITYSIVKIYRNLKA